MGLWLARKYSHAVQKGARVSVVGQRLGTPVQSHTFGRYGNVVACVTALVWSPTIVFRAYGRLV